MNKLWSTESPAIISALLFFVLFGSIFDNWFVASIITLGGYITWLYYRLIKLEKWLARGTKTSEVYDDGGFIGLIIRHLYHQRKLHNKRKKRTKEILRRLNRNISALPDATVLLNDDLEIEWCNAPAQYLLGIDPRHDIGQRIGNLIRYPKFLRYLIAPDKKNNLEIESPIEQNTTLQVKIVRFGRNQRLLTARNISDQKQLQESLKNFVANASHELKTPLTAITGYLEMLENETGLSKTGKTSVQVAQKQAMRMKTLIEDLLLLSQVESYQLQPNEGERVSVNEVMANAMSTVDKQCNVGPIRCKIPDHLYLLGIPSEIEGICINLIDNAIKYSPDDTPIQISWRTNKEGEMEFSVKDQGPGIEADDLTHITERYYRGRNAISEQSSGSGLGLAIVQQAVLKHNGRLDIKSTPEKGSTFTVTFPSYRVLHNKTVDNVVQLANL